MTASPEARQRMREAALRRPKSPPRSEESRERYRQSALRRYESVEEREKTRQSQLERFKSPEEREKLHKPKHTTEYKEKMRELGRLQMRSMSPEELRERMKSVWSGAQAYHVSLPPNELELEVMTQLETLNMPFLFHVPLRESYHVLDFLIPPNIDLECDGGIHQIEQEEDLTRDRYIRSLGFSVVRVHSAEEVSAVQANAIVGRETRL